MATYISFRRDVERIFRTATARSMRGSFRRMQQRLKRFMEMPKSGVEYTREEHPLWVGDRTSPHTAAGPREFPAEWTGDLLKAVLDPGAVEVRITADGVEGELHIESEYAHFLEFGWTTPWGKRVAPRPFLGAAWAQMRDPTKANMGEVLVQELRTADLRGETIQYGARGGIAFRPGGGRLQLGTFEGETGRFR